MFLGHKFALNGYLAVDTSTHIMFHGPSITLGTVLVVTGLLAMPFIDLQDKGLFFGMLGTT